MVGIQKDRDTAIARLLSIHKRKSTKTVQKNNASCEDIIVNLSVNENYLTMIKTIINNDKHRFC